jgi:hypothetical protein
VFVEPLKEIGGGLEYIVVSFFDFFVVLYYITTTIISGAEANLIDKHIRDLLNTL